MGYAVKDLRAIPALAKNFPPSSAQPSSIFHFSGVTPQSTETTRRVLTENDQRYDMWYSPPIRFAHNHFVHSALARYSLGASPALLQRDWESERGQHAALDPAEDGRIENVPGLPDTITRENWVDSRWLGHKDAYSRYLAFFHNEVARLGPEKVLEQYIFSHEANSGSGTQGPRMIIALAAGLVHPFIHVGYGLEFNDPVILAEGLAQACCCALESAAALYPDGWPHNGLPAPREPSKPLIQLYREFTERADLDPGPYDTNILINARLRNFLTPEHVAGVQGLVARWDLSDMSDKGWKARHQELAWLTTLITGATTRPGYNCRVDFFLMHLLTSSLFIPCYMAALPEHHRRTTLQTYALTVFQVLATRGKPKLYLDFAMSASANPSGPLTRAKNGEGNANPWLEIVDNALIANESHVPKSIRSLVYYSQLYGSTPAGGVPGAHDDAGKEAIRGLGSVDGSLFVRVAGKIMTATGWEKDGESHRGWDRSALGWDGAWANERYDEAKL